MLTGIDTTWFAPGNQIIILKINKMKKTFNGWRFGLLPEASTSTVPKP
jgi:hypothetical protein